MNKIFNFRISFFSTDLKGSDPLRILPVVVVWTEYVLNNLYKYLLEGGRLNKLMLESCAFATSTENSTI